MHSRREILHSATNPHYSEQPLLLSEFKASIPEFCIQIVYTSCIPVVERCWCSGPGDYCCPLANRKCSIENDVMLVIHRKSSTFGRRDGSRPNYRFKSSFCVEWSISLFAQQPESSAINVSMNSHSA